MLLFHDPTDRELLKYSITVKTGYNLPRLREDGVQVYIVKKELYGAGVTIAKMSPGYAVPVYDMEWTVCDPLRSRSHMEIQVLRDALK